MTTRDAVAAEKVDAPTPARSWPRRPVIGALLRAVVVLVPLVLSVLAGLVTGWTIGGGGIFAVVVRVVAAGVVSVLVFVGLERLARRLLPLATLLKLTLVFPDYAPSRFSVALRSTSVKHLQQWARTTCHDDGLQPLTEKVVTLAAALNTHDRRTRGHSDRSRAIAELIAVEMGLEGEELNGVRWGAFLHDIGKILVPSTLLNKPGAPTPAEWETLRRHPGDGGLLVEPLRDFLGSGIEAVSQHHENYDGTGYPLGLGGSDIALSARIVSVADSFEVMTAVRAYKKPMTAAQAREELTRHSGSQFDPAVVRALLRVSLGRLHWSTGLVAWAAEVPFLTVIPRAAAQAATLASGSAVSMSTISSVAAISFSSVVFQAAAIPTPVPQVAAPGVARAVGAVGIVGHPGPAALSTESALVWSPGTQGAAEMPVGGQTATLSSAGFSATSATGSPAVNPVSTSSVSGLASRTGPSSVARPAGSGQPGTAFPATHGTVLPRSAAAVPNPLPTVVRQTGHAIPPVQPTQSEPPARTEQSVQPARPTRAVQPAEQVQAAQPVEHLQPAEQAKAVQPGERLQLNQSGSAQATQSVQPTEHVQLPMPVQSVQPAEHAKPDLPNKG